MILVFQHCRTGDVINSYQHHVATLGVEMQRRDFLKTTAAVGSLAVASNIAVAGAQTVSPPGVLTTPAHAAYGSSFLEKNPQWSDNSLHGQWRTMYNGYGVVTGDDTQVLMFPRTVTTPDDTAACMVHTEAWYDDVTFEVTICTEKQLRKNSAPNPWEVGWVCWNFRDDTRFYSAQLKPTEWEIGKEDPLYPGAQRYFATGGDVATGANIWKFPIGVNYRMKVVVKGPTSTVYVNGADGAYRKVYSFTDRQRPYHGGRIGLYTEDARVWFHHFKVLSYSKKSYPPYTDEYWESLNFLC